MQRQLSDAEAEWVGRFLGLEVATLTEDRSAPQPVAIRSAPPQAEDHAEPNGAPGAGRTQTRQGRKRVTKRYEVDAPAGPVATFTARALGAVNGQRAKLGLPPVDWASMQDGKDGPWLSSDKWAEAWAAKHGSKGKPATDMPPILLVYTTEEEVAEAEAARKTLAAGQGNGVSQDVAADGMKDEEIARDIMEKQEGVLEGWDIALDNFETTMTSAADAEATPNFQKAVSGFVGDKLVGAILKKVPVPLLDEAKGLLEAMYKEAERAATAAASATLRDFIVQHRKAVGRFKQAVKDRKEGFASAVRRQSERQGGDAALHKALLDMQAQMTATLAISTPEALFRALSEEWVRHATVAGGMGMRFPAAVVIRITKDLKVLDAHIQGQGGQKLAEQLLKDSPDGVDVFNLKARRRILMLGPDNYPAVSLELDVNNRDVSNGSLLAGDTGSLRDLLLAKGLPPTKELTGD